MKRFTIPRSTGEVLPNKAKIRDVARAAAVSVGTVSRVLNEHPTVTAPVRERVRAAIDALGYERDSIAQSMRGGTTHLVACAIRDFDIPRFATFIKEAERVLREAGYTLILASTSNSAEVEVGLLRAFAARRVDGVMTTISDESNPAVATALRDAPMPVLLIDRDLPGRADRVFADHGAGVQAAARHLLDMGHRRIAMLVGDTRAFPSRSRVAGFEGSVAPEARLLRERVLTAEDAFRETTSLMSLPEPPTALIIGAMDMLGGCLRALKAVGARLGQDVSVIAGSDSELAELMEPGVTAIAWDLAEMGRHAAAMLLERMRGTAPDSGRSLKLPTRLVVRQSCRPPVSLS
ncbi:LacI family transcriptional regulator [Rhodovarius crocodyli]|uniref:LacI family transcriptional regulator n=1 Tax=Rhodovarius crocodyli TaxID=1979269 RepID=A0A437MIP8_9PROT|nr:LacI family transcriptional regulator [Rhodovarius crocodyli]